MGYDVTFKLDVTDEFIEEMDNISAAMQKYSDAINMQFKRATEKLIRGEPSASLYIDDQWEIDFWITDNRNAFTGITNG